MRAIETLRTQIPEEIFNYTQITSALRHYSKPRDVISKFLADGDVIRIRKGLYIFSNFWRRKSFNPELLANLIYGPSLISLDYVLSSAGLIPESVPEITSLCTGRSRIFDTPVGRFSYRQISKARFIFRSEWNRAENGSFFSARPIKALADKIFFDKRFIPTSPLSYDEYLLRDLRVDETVLKDYVTGENLTELDAVYNVRRISWFIVYLKRKYSLQ